MRYKRGRKSSTYLAICSVDDSINVLFVINVHVYSPFTAITQDGRLTTNAFMAEYNQDRFELEIQAKETQPPERTTTAKVLVSSFLFFSQQT